MGVLKVYDGTDWRKIGCGSGVATSPITNITPDIAEDPSQPDSAFSSGTYAQLYNGNRLTTDYINVAFGTADLTLDLLGERYVDHVNVLMYYGDGRTYGGLTVYGYTAATYGGTGTLIYGPTDYDTSIDGSAGIDIPIAGTWRYLQLITHGNTGGIDSNDFVEYEIYAGPVAQPGRLKLWTGTGWVREACDDDTGLVTTSGYCSDPAAWWYGLNFEADGVGPRILTAPADPPGAGDALWGYVATDDPDGICSLAITGWDHTARAVRTASSFYMNGPGSFVSTTEGDTISIPAGWTIYRGFYTDLYTPTHAAGTLPPTSDRHPLKLWDGTDWVTVACLVPV